MTKIASLFLFAFLLLSCPFANAETFSARVIGVSDGDTITVLRDQNPIKIRLAEIDCPEKAQAFGSSARARTGDLLFGKTVLVSTLSKDRYGRFVANVSVDGKNLSEELVSSGYAWCYRKYSKNNQLLQQEADAKSARRGLWADPQPTPPWEYRRH
jgi:endonuclease YncB( thermonuclease family)